ncbi:MAG TPA: hypothetical protein VFK74_09090 [Azospira sp.]|nr:hypothetical protein [Azospira sp.]
MILPQGKRRFSLTLPILGYALLDVVGMVAFAVGLAYLAGKEPLFFRSFPSTLGEAVLSTVAGLGLMLWAAAQVLRETLKQVPEKKTTEQP